MITGKGVRFIRNPKTASGSIAHRLYEAGLTREGEKHDWPSEKPREMTFGVVRDPWDRMLSAWSYWEPNDTFAAWLMGKPKFVGGVDVKRTSQHQWLGMCDRVLRFERLSEEWPEMAKALGARTSLPKINASRRGRGRYTGETQDFVAEHFGWEISEYGYSL